MAGQAWRPGATAPKDGSIFFSYWDDIPVFVAWCGPVLCQRERRVGPFWNRRTIPAQYDEHGFRVLMPPARNLGWGIHGNFAPFTPEFWMPLPLPPEPDQ